MPKEINTIGELNETIKTIDETLEGVKTSVNEQIEEIKTGQVPAEKVAELEASIKTLDERYKSVLILAKAKGDWRAEHAGSESLRTW